MSDFAGTHPHPLSSQYASLETRVGGIEKTVDNLTRKMDDQNASLRHEMGQQTHGILTSIEKLTITAGEGNRALRAEFNADLKTITDKQGLKSGTLIALGMLAIAAFTAIYALIARPTDNAITDIKAVVAKHENEIISRAEHERADKLAEKYEARQDKLKERAEAREDRLRDRIYDLESKATDTVRTRTIQRLDDQDRRLRSVEEKTAK